MSKAGKPPQNHEFELTLLGPGYGESIVMHIGGGEWVVIDSFMDSDERPAAVRYLESIGVEPAKAVVLVVATHWHDDHIRGLAHLVKLCAAAEFCCAAALCREEFLALVGALGGRYFSASGSGLREIHDVFSQLKATNKKPTHALANRVLLRNKTCTIWSLSPGDRVFQRFLKSVERLVPNQGANKTRLPSLAPNEAAVALWVDVPPFSLLLGADLEKSGWKAILDDKARPAGRASAFKVPHHGSSNADMPEVWAQLLVFNPYAVLAPWSRGGRVLPTRQDAKRITAATANAYVSTAKMPPSRSGLSHGDAAVAKTLRESGVRLRPLNSQTGSVRLRRCLGSTTSWSVELRGDACHLRDFAA